MGWRDDDLAAPPPVPTTGWQADAPAGPSPQQKAVVKANDNGEEAARALGVAKRTGIPAPLVHSDLPGYSEFDRTQTAIKYINQNPFLAKYVDENPMAASVSADDYKELDEASQTLQALHPEVVRSKAQVGLWQGVPEIAGMLGTAPGREKLLGALKDLPGALLKGLYEPLLVPGKVKSGELNLGTEEGMNQAIGLGLGIGLGAGGAKGTIKTGRPEAPAGTVSFDNFMHTLEGFKTRQEIDDFIASKHPGPPGAMLQIEHAKAGAEALDNAVEAAQGSKTKERSPELFAEMANGHDAGDVHVDGQKIVELYEKEGKSPAEGDGLFGFVPNIAAKAQAAAATGGEVTIPVGDYVAHIDEAVHKQVGGSVRLHNDGVTMEEAKEIKDTEPGISLIDQSPLEETNSAEFRIQDKDGNKLGTAFVSFKDFDELGQPLTASIDDIFTTEFEDTPTTPEGLAAAHEAARNKLGPSQMRELLRQFRQQYPTVHTLQGKRISGAHYEGGFDADPIKGGVPVKVKLPEISDNKTEARIEEAVSKEKQSLFIHPEVFLNMLFKDGKAVGITEPEIKRYSDLIAGQEQAVLDKAVAAGKREASRRLAPEWKRNEATLKGEVTNELTNSGAFAAEKYLRDHRIDIAHDNAAVVADGLAPHFGFETGQDLLRGLQSIEIERAASGKGPQVQLRDAIKAETASRMEAKYGDLKANIAKEARQIALAEHSFDVMAEEVRLLAKANGVTPPLSRTELTAWAQQTFEASNIRDAGNWEKHRRAVERGGRETEKALLKKDWQEAFQAKQRQVLAAEVAKQSLKLQGVIDGAESKLDRFSSEETIKSMDQEHLEQLRQMFASVGLPQHYAPLRDTVPLRDFVTQSQGQLAIAPWLMDGTQPKLQDMSVAQFRDFVKSMQSLEHAGREALKLRNAHGEALLENVVRDAVQSLERFPFIEQPTLNPSIMQRMKSYGRLVVASHQLVEKVLDYTDRFNPHGPITEWLDRPLRDGNTKEIVLEEMATRKMRDLRQYVDASVLEKIPNKLIKDSKSATGFMKMDRGNLRILMANMGTWSNIQKTVEGFGVNEADLRRFIHQNAKPTDVAWVNGIWDIFAALKPEADAVNLRDTGVPVDSHPAVPWDIKAGSLTGGYYPISYDPRNSNIQAQIAKPLFDAGYHTRNTITPHGYTEARTAYKGAIDLSGLNLSTKIQSMIHDIAFREAVRNADKLIRHPDFKNAMENYWSNEVADLLPGWLRDIANSHNFDDNYAKDLVRASSLVRQNVVNTLISINPNTMLKHGTAAAIMSVDRVGLFKLLSAGKDIGAFGTLKGLRDLISYEGRLPDEAFMQSFRDALDQGQRGKNARQFMLDSSAVMRDRLRQSDDSIRGAVDAITKIGPAQTFANVRQRAIQIGRLGIAFADQLSAQTTWDASYKAAYAKGEAHADAVFIADRDVSRTHGSSFIGDQPAVTRLGNSGPAEITKWFTQFYKFWNHQANNNLHLVWDVAAKIRGPAAFEPLQGGGGAPPLVPPNVLDFSKDGSGDWRYAPEPGARAARIAWGILQIAAFIYIEEMTSSLLAPNDQDKHGFGTRMFLATLRYFGSQTVFTRDFVHAKAGGYEPSTGIIGTLWKGLSDTLDDMGRTAEGRKSKNWITNTATTVGDLTGIIGSQAGRTVKGLVGYATGNEHPRGVADWTQLLSKGSVKGRKHK